MSTSPKPALAPVTDCLSNTADLLPFPYDLVSESGVSDPSTSRSVKAKVAVSAAISQDDQRLAEIRREAQEQARKMFDEQLGRERSGIAQALAQFTRDRAAYFEKVEAEVVQLALSIARKILHREAQVDTLLLAGIVRIALEQVDKATGVTLRVHPQNADDWRHYLTTRLDPADVPEILNDPKQPVDSCTLETAMGVTSFGLDV